MHCPKCHCEITKIGAAFCPNCGEKLDTNSANDVIPGADYVNQNVKKLSEYKKRWVNLPLVFGIVFAIWTIFAFSASSGISFPVVVLAVSSGISFLIALYANTKINNACPSCRALDSWDLIRQELVDSYRTTIRKKVVSEHYKSPRQGSYYIPHSADNKVGETVTYVSVPAICDTYKNTYRCRQCGYIKETLSSETNEI